MGDRLQDKVCIVTGGGRGIGRAVVKRFAKEGAKVMAVSVSDSGKAVADEVGPAVEFFQCDVSKPEQVQAMAEHCRKRYGRLDVLVNNAGKGNPAPKRIHEIPVEEWDDILNTNLRGTFLVMKYCLPVMLESGGGSIVNMASIGSFHATPMFANYITSKHGMMGLTRNGALEYIKDNIRVNAVCPGFTHTEIVDGVPPQVFEQLCASVPMGRPATTDEVANLTLFLASDEASHITGAAYVIDGGRSAV